MNAVFDDGAEDAWLREQEEFDWAEEYESRYEFERDEYAWYVADMQYDMMREDEVEAEYRDAFWDYSDEADN